MTCEPLITAEDAARILGVSAKTVKRMAARAEIPALQIASRWRFRASELDEFIRNRLGFGRQPRPEGSNKFQ
ncbi:MAG: helix-turn-helix domain-containing protein [Acidobacteriales bacterium]|nr:helix-turn-helix domain-containing protein [Terriglobales bacterium]